MNPRIAFPFLVIPHDAIRPEGWLIGDPGTPLHRATDVLENWDYARDLEVANSVSIDWAAAAGALQLPEDKLRLKFSLIVGTGAGTLPRRQDRLDHALHRFDPEGAGGHRIHEEAGLEPILGKPTQLIRNAYGRGII